MRPSALQCTAKCGEDALLPFLRLQQSKDGKDWEGFSWGKLEEKFCFAVMFEQTHVISRLLRVFSWLGDCRMPNASAPRTPKQPKNILISQVFTNFRKSWSAIRTCANHGLAILKSWRFWGHARVQKLLFKLGTRTSCFQGICPFKSR